MHRLSKERFSEVTNSIGRFIYLEDQVLHVVDKIMPRVFVEMDSLEGLPAELKILWERGPITQRLDY